MQFSIGIRSFVLFVSLILITWIAEASEASESSLPLPYKGAHAIGIDLSTPFIYVSEYDLSTKTFHSIASIDPPELYHSFMWEIYLRHEAERRNWHQAWNVFHRTSYYRAVISTARRVLGRYSWTTRLAGLLPVVLEDHEFRYPFNSDLDVPVPNMPGFSLMQPGPVGDEATNSSPNMSLSKATFVQVCTQALNQVRVVAIEKRGIDITFATISKPAWLFGDMDDLLEEAAQNAGIELLSQPKPRLHVVLALARHWGSGSPAVIEQTGASFEFQQESSSWSENPLSTMYIPNFLAHQILARETFNQTRDVMKATIFRLRAQIIFQLTLFWRQRSTQDDIEIVDETSGKTSGGMPSGIQVVVRDYGCEGCTLDEHVSAWMVKQSESRFMNAVEARIIEHTLKFVKVHEHMKKEGLVGDESDGEDENVRRRRILEFAIKNRLTLHSETWWNPVDGLLVLAEHPYNQLITTSATNVLKNIPGFQDICSVDASDPRECLLPDLAARGAAFEAATHVKNAQQQEIWERCMDGDDRYCSSEYLESRELDRALQDCIDGDESRCPPVLWDAQAKVGQASVHEEL